MTTTNNTKQFAILGSPVSHTLSPMMHNFIAEKNNIDMEYRAFDVSSDAFDEFFTNIKTSRFLGFNITAPHKISVMKHLDVISDDAKKIGSVNTVVNKNGVWHGYNTDGDGFCESLLIEGHCIRDKHILLMGAGGAARSLCCKLAEKGAKSITVTARTMEKVHIIGDMLEQYTDVKFYDTIQRSSTYDFVINTTPLGMHPYEEKNPCDFMDMISERTVCCDLIYNPEKTEFLKAAEKRKATIINGLGMLVCQGILAFELFHDITLDRKLFYDLLMKKLSNF